MDPEAEIRVLTKKISLPATMNSSITKASLIRGAWSLVLSRHASTADITFGATLSGRNAPVVGLQDMAGPTIATVPVRIQIDRTQCVGNFLQKVQTQAFDMVANEHFGLHNIARLGSGPKAAADFTTLLVIQPRQYLDDEEDVSEDAVILFGQNELDMTEQEMRNYFNYSLVLQGHLYDDYLDCRFFHNSSVISDKMAEAIAYQMEHVVQQLITRDNVPLSDISLIGDWDINHAIASSHLMPASRTCVHDRILQTIAKQPDHEAVVAWDGNLTYKELGIHATRLAARLQDLGVGPETLVPFCFPKSVWAAVSMVAIEMAGGAFVPLDPAAPSTRIQGILEDVGAKIVLCSPSNEKIFEQFDIKVMPVTETGVKSLPDPAGPVVSGVNPDNACFVIFTSGSTGKPKGMIHTHSGFCSNADGFGNTPGVGPGTRVYAFSAYVFDVGITDVIITLIHGGTICIPSDHDRQNNLIGSINALKANWLFTTPTVAGLINPKQVPLVTTLCTGGEAITSKVVDPWLEHGEVHGIYGPAEACICGWREGVGREGKPSNLGISLMTAFWIVEPDNYHQLVPVGCVGEALIEGPTLARGYINVDSQVSAAFIDDASWLPRLPGQTGPRRVYRSGDLLRRNEDGTYTYMGRKDTQVKLHGQRIELGEIEYRVSQHLPNDMDGIVDVISGTDIASDILMALLWYKTGKGEDFKLQGVVTDDMKNVISVIDHSLNLVLPQYMVPSTYLIFCGKPEQTTSGKVNRLCVAAAARGTTAQERSSFAPGAMISVPPTTALEFEVREMWAEILGISAESIGKHDSFLRLGGDSISAIKLATLAGHNGLNISVNTIFKKSRLSEMAFAAEGAVVEEDGLYETTPLCMIPAAEKDEVIGTALEQCDLNGPGSIEDVFPCTSLQEGLMALALKQPGSYLAKEVYRLAEDVDIPRFKASWEEVVRRSGNLRTRIIRHGKQMLQAVLRDHSWETSSADGMDTFMTKAAGLSIGFGDSLCQYALYEENDGNWYFGIVIHHAIFDGWTLGLIFSALREIYAGGDAYVLSPYSSFVKYIRNMDTERAINFWKKELAGASRATFPATRSLSETARPETAILTRAISMPSVQDAAITRATVIRAAWAIVLGRYCDTEDVTFGATISGRNANVPGLTEMVGPAIATVPIRVRLSPDLAVARFLQKIQSQATEMVEHEQFGLQNIQRINGDIADAIRFSSLVVVQPLKQMGLATAGTEAELFTVDEEKLTVQDAMAGYFSYPLVIQFILDNDQVEVNMTYDPEVLSERELTALSYQFEGVVNQLVSPHATSLKAIDVASDWDRQQAHILNDNMVKVYEELLHDKIEQQSLIHPDDTAIHGWDHKLSYRELIRAANRLAHLLFDQYTVAADELVHVVFDHSAWFFVAVLAINKAGGKAITL